MYLYHIRIELLVPSVSSDSGPKFTLEDTEDHKQQAPLPSAFPSDIFDPLLPSYRIGTVDKLARRSKHKLRKTLTVSPPKSVGKTGSPGTTGPDVAPGSTCDGDLSRPQNITRRRIPQLLSPSGVKAKDWRAGNLSIEWFDWTDECESSAGKMEEQFELASFDPVLSTAGHDDEHAHGLSGPRRKQRKKKRAYITPTSGAFIPFKNGKTELNAGILHLYREMSEIEDVLQERTTTDSPGSATEALSDQLSASKGTGLILCVLAVPSYMTPQDFLSFVGSTKDNMSHLRMLRDSLPNRYMVLIKFRNQETTDAFYRDFNGREFSALESEVCHVVYIKSVEFKSQAIPPYAFPPVPDDPSALMLPARPPTSVTPMTTTELTAPNTNEDLRNTDDTERPFASSPVRSPTSNQFLELPTCPVCLDRMDASATGLLTIFCHHTFHCHCLSKWGDSSCPVCRYSSQRALSADADESSLNECVDCGATENLWICLICGNIGCGRYQAGHAQRHYVESDHLYALELETQRVWDYAGDGYVHRLIQNRADGKLVELSAPTTSDMMGPNPDGSVITDPDGKHTSGMVSPEKLESLGLEYTYLLTSQLESQRLWYESRLGKLESMLTEQVSQFTASFDQLQRERDSALQQRDELQNQLAGFERDSRTLQNRLTKVLDRVIILEKDLRDERALNKSLLGNQTAYATQITEQKELVKKKDEKIQDLEEQVHDLMAFVEMRKQVEEIKELEGAQTIGVAPAPQPSGRGRKGKGRK
ncbi:hypothetical protein HDU85_004408 [Gaertneriomyces sp. JEL0708]|nr:hypothetical protein HDU85_004408 [Gaertneriomyces sp. JEL0708]